MSNFKQLTDEKGQLSIFLGISLVIVTTMIAFIVNVGLFVKAKINLQNAVDAAAYSGAAVQARQLTNMSHLNWEMRNTYKEWMFKYYVLGQLGLTNVKNPGAAGGDRMDFSLKAFDPSSGNFDPYNVPSICIHFGSSNNICEIYNVPGLPQFETPGLPSISDQFQSIMNAFTESKAKDCSVRSNLNFGAAMMWAYGTSKLDFNQMPLVASQRVGAWPQAIELALRMRNLEMIANRPPVANICLSDKVPGCTRVDALNANMGAVPINERPIKAFMAAYRNLSGGVGKDPTASANSAIQDDLSLTFSLTEIPPQPFQPALNTLSSFLIPPSSQGMQKYYVDLQAYPLNLTTFFTSFVTNSDASSIGNIVGSGVAVEANCGATKTALPVPGYMMGYTKNPEVLTYYAVKGKAKFVGLFYPFTEAEGIELSAYAAAKPFGGRIGPRLFNPDGAQVKAREENRQFRSTPYLSAINTAGLTFSAGLPIPIDPTFWVKDANDPVGGVPSAGSVPTFAIPNILYDYGTFGDLSNQHSSAAGAIQTIQRKTVAVGATIEEIGLYSKNQFLPFRGHLPPVGTNVVVTSAQIDAAIESVRAPTKYEALNYLIPTYEASPIANPESLDSAPSVIKLGSTPAGNVQYQIFAPLYGPGTLFSSETEITAVISDYLQDNEPAIDSFLASLQQVADTMRATTTSGPNSYAQAADSIHMDPNTDITTGDQCASLSMATKFHTFFKSPSAQCGITPLDQLITQYISDQNNSSPDPSRPFSTYYMSTYKKPTGITNNQLSTGYVPGPRSGALDDGTLKHPFLPRADLIGKRNSYSTKFISLSSVVNNGSPGSFLDNKPIYSEDAGSNPDQVTLENPSDLLGSQVRNEVLPNDVSDLGPLTH